MSNRHPAKIHFLDKSSFQSIASNNIETSQLTGIANQFTGFFMTKTLATD